MVREHMEKLVLDVVLSQADDEEILNLDSNTTVLDVDQLTMMHIVLALETRLGVELPTSLEDARTVAELVTGVLEALRGNAQEEVRPVRQQVLPLVSAVTSVSG
jgi:acyl carrier protein